jgi:hypothetical protein
MQMDVFDSGICVEKTKCIEKNNIVKLWCFGIFGYFMNEKIWIICQSFWSTFLAIHVGL